MKGIFWGRVQTFFYKIESNRLLAIIRRGLTMLVPAIVVGALACAILQFPNEAYQYLITERYPGIAGLLEFIYQATFGMFSMLLVGALSFSYAVEKGEDIDQVVFYVLTSIASFGSQIITADEETRLQIMGNQGCFVAMVIGFASAALFSRLKRVKKILLEKYTVGMEMISANAIHSIIPSAITIGFFALFQYGFLAINGGKSIYILWAEVSCNIFEKLHHEFAAALLYTLLVHILWAVGFHGSHMMETAAEQYFAPVGENIVFSKSFFDTYVVMGGCGTTICVLIGVLFFTRKKRMQNLGKIAFPTVIFNSNEILNFGIPLMLNPVMMMPFIAVPVMALCISYGAVSLGLVPPVTHSVSWAMPIFFNGYMATGSIAGSILQIVIVILGVAIYVPFLRMYEKVYEHRMKEKIDHLIEELKEYESKGEEPDFLHRMDDSGMVARMLLQELKGAVRKKELYLLYQPQVDGAGKYIGAESLLRWNHPEYGFMYPPLIIYLAKYGKILPQVEREIFDMAIGAIRKIDDRTREYKDSFKVSVNITAHSLDWEIEEYIKEKLEEYQVSAELLWLEITEQDVLINSDCVIRKINHLKNEGHRLLIDDFGMGHTSLLYLQSEYFDVVKLDGSLVREIIEKKTNQKIVASVIELGKKLDVKVTAEYVETMEQKQMLEEMGCDWYQGYLYGKPMPLDEFIEKMRVNWNIS